MPRTKPPYRRFGQVDFASMIPFDPATPLGVNDILVMRRANGGGNVLVTVGEIQAHGGAVNISDLIGGVDEDMLFKTGGIWSATAGLLKWNGSRLEITGDLQFPVLGSPKLLNASGTIALPNMLPNGLDPNTGIVTSIDSMWLVTGGLFAINYREANDHVIVTSEMHVGLTASTTQTQAGALELLSTYNQVSVVANSGDAVRLPSASQTANQGRRMLIINDGANDCQMFPTSGQDIGAGVDTSVSLTAGKSAYFIAISSGPPTWRQIFEDSAAPAATVFPLFQFPALIFENPNNADWTVNALAPAIADSNNNGLTVRAFDDTIEEGVGFTIRLPDNANNGPGPDTTDIIFTCYARAETAPAGDRDVRFKFYNRIVRDNLVVTPWDSGLTFANVTFPANEFFQKFTFTISFFSGDFEAGELTQFEMTRVAPQGGNANLPGDMILAQLEVSFA